MPNIQVQLRRGSTSDHASFAGAEGEVTVDTDLDTIMVHTGGGAGTGIRLAKHSELSTGGGGTVVSIASGTGLTGGPITTSGTLSLAPIANLRALGNVSGSNAAPVAVEIKDDDTMATASATSLATSESIKAYVDAQVAASTVSKYSTGWFNNTTGLTNGTNYTFTNSAGTTDIVIDVFVADDANGTNAQKLITDEGGSTSQVLYGGFVTDLTSSNFKIQLGSNGYLAVTSSGGYSTVNWNSGKYFKAVYVG